MKSTMRVKFDSSMNYLIPKDYTSSRPVMTSYSSTQTEVHHLVLIVKPFYPSAKSVSNNSSSSYIT